MDTLHAMRTYTYLLFIYIYIHLYVHRRPKTLFVHRVLVQRAMRVYVYYNKAGNARIIGIWICIYFNKYIYRYKGWRFFCYFSARNALRPGADVFIIYIRAPEYQNTAPGHVHHCSSRQTMMPNLRSQVCLHHYPCLSSFVIIIILTLCFTKTDRFKGMLLKVEINLILELIFVFMSLLPQKSGPN